jgi:hypothetical protein
MQTVKNSGEAHWKCMAWRGISGNVRVLLCVKATADLLRPLTLKRDLASPDCGAFSVAPLDLIFPAFTPPACTLSAAHSALAFAIVCNAHTGGDYARAIAPVNGVVRRGEKKGEM